MKPEPQPTWYEILKDAAACFLLFGLAFAFFRYSGDFTKGQSGLLGLVVGSFMFGLYRWKREDKRRLGFAPFRVTIIPQWKPLLLDFHVLDEQGFEALKGQRESAADEIRSRRYDVLRDGVTFTVLRPNLIYRDGLRSFRTSADLAVELEEISAPLGGAIPSLIGGVWFFLKQGFGGYELGIGGIGPEFEPTATLPYEEFWPSYGFGITEKSERRMTSALKAQGWQRGEDRSWQTELCHKYFTVYYRQI